MYLDDGIVAVQGENDAVNESMRVQQELSSSTGFIVNEEKSQWEPSQCIEWLGFMIDLLQGQFYVPAHKVESLKSQLQMVLQMQTVPARMLASVLGKIISMSLALGPVTRLMTRSLYSVLNVHKVFMVSTAYPDPRSGPGVKLLV